MDSPLDSVLKTFAKFTTPEIVRENLVSAALLITAFESLREHMTSRLLGFYATDWVGLEPQESDSYRQEVISRHKKRYEATCLWFLDNGAIDQHDFDSILACRHHRNDVVHDLLKYLVDPAFEVDLSTVDEILRLHTKVERWWIKEIEIPTNPDFDGVEVQDEDITGGLSSVLAIIRHVAQSQQLDQP